jgi:hypothetical protein
MHASTCSQRGGEGPNLGTAEDIFIVASGLPPDTGFDFFVIQG